MDTTNHAVGLCATCRHLRWVRTDKGSSFVLCTLAAVDASFPRYPRLPVRVCAGYRQTHPQSE